MAGLYVEVVPRSFDAIETLTTLIRADFITNFARPGVFNEVTSGFIFHYRERGSDGSLRGVFMQDRRDPAHITTYISEVGKTVTRDGETYLVLSRGTLVLSKGTYQRPERSGISGDCDLRRLRHRSVSVHRQRGKRQGPERSGDSDRIVTFDKLLAFDAKSAEAPRMAGRVRGELVIDLSQFVRKEETIKRPRERTTAELMRFDPKDPSGARQIGRIRGELIDRLASPLYAFAAGLIGFAALGEARTTRQGRGVATGIAVLLFLVLRMLGVAVTSLVVSDPHAGILAFALPLLACRLCGLPRCDLRRAAETRVDARRASPAHLASTRAT